MWGKFSEVMDTKQDKLTGAVGQVVGFDADGTATAVRGWSNTNLLDNWYLAGGGSQLVSGKFPINQKGKTEYVVNGGSSVYTIDRWRSNRVTVELAEDGVRLSNPVISNGWGGYMYEPIEHDRIPDGSTVTMSCIIDGELYYTTIDDVNKSMASQSIPFDDRKILLVCESMPSSKMYGFYIYNQAANTSRTIKAAKVELGPVQTLAHQDADGNWVLNDPPPDYALELEKCQRYYIKLNWGPRLACYYPNHIQGFSFPTTMRANPSVSLTLYKYVSSTPIDFNNLTIHAYRAGIDFIYLSGSQPGEWYGPDGIILDANL